MQGISISGRKCNNGIDFYQTPTWAIEALLKNEKFEGTILEPCSGAGAISKVLEQHGYEVISSDIRNDPEVYGTQSCDIFDYENFEVDNIITNPPFKYAQEIVEKSLELTTKKVAMLLKLVFLESERRYDFFQNTPLKNIYVFCKRITMYPQGTEKPKNSGTIAYAWYVWEHGYEGDPVIKWIV